MGPRLERRPHVSNRRLPGRGIEGTDLKKRVGPSHSQPLMHIASDLRVGEIRGQQLLGRESILRGQPAEPARAHTSNPPSYAVVVAEFLLFSLEECNEGPADIAEADDA